MLHVFAETNWVVDWAAPAWYRNPLAQQLFDRAGSGQICLHIPSLCLAEARGPILKKHQAAHAALIEQFLRWGVKRQVVEPSDSDAVRRVLNIMEDRVEKDLEALEGRLASLRTAPGIEVFEITGAMLERAAGFSLQKLDLQLFDQAILAAILTRAEELNESGETDLAFCELDRDLQPWDKQGKTKPVLAALYEKARIWVYDDFALQRSPRPEGWPDRNSA